MFFNRNKPPVASPADFICAEKFRAVGDARFHLDECVKRVAIKQGVINLYPEGADKEAAVKEAEAAKYSLLCAIGTFDSLKQDFIDWYEIHKDELVTKVDFTPYRFKKSHTYVEMEYEKIFTKGF